VLGSDVVRRQCCVDTLRNQLNNSDHAVILLVVENRVTTGEVYDGLADAGVFMRLLTDPASLCILLVFVCDKDNKRMPDALIAAVKRMQVDSFKQQLEERAAAVQQANGMSERGKSKRLKAAKRSINFITVETHPEKIRAHVQANTTAATPELSALQESIMSYGIDWLEHTQVRIMQELGDRAALQAYMSYQAVSVSKQEQSQHAGSSLRNGKGRSADGSSAGNYKQTLKPLETKLTRVTKLLCTQVILLNSYYI
jgi:hypothetical protein